MPTPNIPICSEDAIVSPIKVHVKDGTPQRVEFLPLGAQDNQIPTLSADQLHIINQTLRQKVVGVLDICQKNNALFATFATERERYEQLFHSKDVVDVVITREEAKPVAKSEGSKQPVDEDDPVQRSNAFLKRTGEYLRGDVDTEVFLGEVADASTVDIAKASQFLIAGIEFGTLNFEKAELYPYSIFDPYINERLHGAHLYFLFKEISSNPNDAENWANLAISYFYSGKAPEAMAAARWAVALNPVDGNNWQALALVLFAHYLASPGDRQGARFRLDRAMAKAEELDREDPDGMPEPGKTNSDETEGKSAPPVAPGSPQAGHTPDRILDYVQGKGEIDTEAYLALVADASAEDVTEVSEILLQEIEFGFLSSKEAELYPHSIFDLEINERLHDSQIHYLFEMIRDKPNDATNWANLAISYFYSNKAPEAMAAARWAVALNPVDGNNWQALALVLFAHYLASPGDRQGARFRLERAMAKVEELDREDFDDMLEPDKTSTDDTEGSSTPLDSEGTSSTSTPASSSSGSSTAPDRSMSEYEGQTTISVGGFAINEKDFHQSRSTSSTLSRRSASILYRRRNSHQNTMTIDIMGRSAASAYGLTLPSGFTVPFPAGSATLPVH